MYRELLLLPLAHSRLIGLLGRRELAARYRGSWIGGLWPWLTPLLMLLVFTFVFGVVLKTRHPQYPDADLAGFGLLLMSGLLIHALLVEVWSKAAMLICSCPNYVTKMVFPLEVLPLVDVKVAVVHGVSALAIVLLANGFWGTGWHPSQLALPLVLLPVLPLVAGGAWMLAAVGVYFRDLGQLVQPGLTAMLFLSPVFYPRSSLPLSVQDWVSLNPLSIPVEQARRALFAGLWPEPLPLLGYAAVGIAAYVLGLLLFRHLKRGFADVL